jgi:hypothetical protein
VLFVVVYAVAVCTQGYALLHLFIRQLKPTAGYQFIDAVFFRPDVMEVNGGGVGKAAVRTRLCRLKIQPLLPFLFPGLF